MEKDPRVKFTSYEHFIVRTEQPEEPREMKFLTTYAADRQGMESESNRLFREELERLIAASGAEKQIASIEQKRVFLKRAWQRDAYLYFNGVYFPWRWIDTKGQNRPEREAYVIDKMNLKPGSKVPRFPLRVETDSDEGILAIGEGGNYVPDSDNKILLFSSGAIGDMGAYSKEELEQKAIGLHQSIFGADIEPIMLPKPADHLPHIDTHVSIVPKTKIVLLDHEYYDVAAYAGGVQKLVDHGYAVTRTEPARVFCPLNILYLERPDKSLVAFMNPEVTPDVKKILKDNSIECFDVDPLIAHELDVRLGNIRCVTNELPSLDPDLIRRLGFQLSERN